MKLYLGITVMVVLFLLSQSSADTLYTEESAIIQASTKALQSTVKITSGVNHGTGFYISPNELLTNFHVIKDGIGTITTYDKRTCTAKLKYQDSGIDLALLTTDCTGVPLELTDSYTVGQTVLTVGNPSIYDFMVTRGIVSGERWKHILFDAPITQGSSGGALVNIEGKVIGVVTAVDSKIGFIGYAITAKEVNNFLRRAQ